MSFPSIPFPVIKCVLNSNGHPFSRTIRLDAALEEQVRSIPGVTKLIRQLSTDVLLTNVYDGDELWSTSVSGVPKELADAMEKSVIQGKVSYEELLDGDKIILNKKSL